MKDRTLRQQLLLRELEQSGEPVTGTQLATRLQVTRQVVVQDIALLKASGTPVMSTARGYSLAGQREGSQRTVLAVQHTPEQTRAELFALVDHGIHVVDVIVEHSLYGEITGGLHLRSRHEVESFATQVESQGIALLSSLTSGHHMHTVEFTHPEHLRDAIVALRALGIRVED